MDLISQYGIDDDRGANAWVRLCVILEDESWIMRVSDRWSQQLKQLKAEPTDDLNVGDVFERRPQGSEGDQ